jgi:hypothetical protein
VCSSDLGSLENVTIERQASVLAGPVVLADSAAAALVNCTIQGGQGAGVMARGAACRLTLDQATVAGNSGHGVAVSDGAALFLVNSRVEENTGSGLLVGSLSFAEAAGTTLAGNGRCGIAVEGDGEVRCADCAVLDHPEWGVLATASARLDLSDVDLFDNAGGAIHLTGASNAVLASVTIRGGADGIVAAGTSRLVARGIRIRDVVGSGLELSESASLDASGLEVVRASASGAVLASHASVAIAGATVVQCGGDGIVVESGSPAVTRSILAYNGGAGLRVDTQTAPPPVPELSYNTVWANGADYVGTARPPTDLAASPNLEIGRASCRERVS